MDPEDREHLDRFEWTPELRRDYGERAWRVLASLQGLEHLDTEDPGPCADCGRDTLLRFRVGDFLICRECLPKRRQADPTQPRPRRSGSKE
jgi:hypothetical protein